MRFAPKRDPYKRIPARTVVSTELGEVVVEIQEAASGRSISTGRSRLFMSAPEAKKLIKDLLDAVGA